jgi:SAM-dependent methyltransferase
LEVVRQVGVELNCYDHAKEYFELLRDSYVDDLVHIQALRQPGLTVEIGGYPFCFSLCLGKIDVELITVDLAPQRAGKLIEEHSLSVRRLDIEHQSLPFNDGSVAMVCLCATFEHLRSDPLFALEEIRRVLQPNGVLYLTTPNLYRVGNIISFLLGNGLAFDPIREYGKLRGVGHMGHVREYTASEMRRFLDVAGFRSIDVKMRATPSRRGKFVDMVYKLAPAIRGELVVTATTAPIQNAGNP